MRLILIATIAAIVLASGCTETPVTPPVSTTFYVAPSRALLVVSEQLQLAADLASTPIDPIVWSLTSGPGSIDADGLYTAPSSIDSDSTSATVEARVNESTSGTATITIVKAPGNRICFERDIHPILVSNCALAGCHDPASRQHGYDFTLDRSAQRAVRPGEPIDSRMYQMITHPVEVKRMPPPPRAPLSIDQVESIRRWIIEGAQVRACAVPGDCDTSAVTYGVTIRTLMLSYCTACHDGPTIENLGVTLSTHAGVRAVALTGQLLGAVAHQPGYAPMPSATVKLENCDIESIRAWIAAGAPNN